MIIRHTTDYVVERATVKAALERYDWYRFLESPHDTPTTNSPSATEYLRKMNPRKIIYIVVTSNVLSCELVEDK